MNRRTAIFIVGFVALCHSAFAPPVAPGGFSVPAPVPIPDANPAVREDREILVPTEIDARRNYTGMYVGDGAATAETIKVKVGHKMEVGMITNLYIFPEGGVRPRQPSRGTLGPTMMSKHSSGTSFFAAKPDGFLASGKPFVAEMDIILFETDMPGPALEMLDSKKYKVIWEKTLRSTPKEMNIPDIIRKYMDATPAPQPAQATPPVGR